MDTLLRPTSLDSSAPPTLSKLSPESHRMALRNVFLTTALSFASINGHGAQVIKIYCADLTWGFKNTNTSCLYTNGTSGETENNKAQHGKTSTKPLFKDSSEKSKRPHQEIQVLGGCVWRFPGGQALLLWNLNCHGHMEPGWLLRSGRRVVWYSAKAVACVGGPRRAGDSGARRRAFTLYGLPCLPAGADPGLEKVN